MLKWNYQNDFNDYLGFDKQLGQGGFGSVFLAKIKSFGKNNIKPEKYKNIDEIGVKFEIKGLNENDIDFEFGKFEPAVEVLNIINFIALNQSPHFLEIYSIYTIDYRNSDKNNTLSLIKNNYPDIYNTILESFKNKDLWFNEDYIPEDDLDFNLLDTYIPKINVSELELADGSLSYLIDQKYNEMMDNNSIKNMMFEFLWSIYCLHKNSILHGDIKPDNILFSKNILHQNILYKNKQQFVLNKKLNDISLKFGDYNLCSKIKNEMNRARIVSVGTPLFSPKFWLVVDIYGGQYINHNIFDVDIYGTGLTILSFLITHIKLPNNIMNLTEFPKNCAFNSFFIDENISNKIFNEIDEHKFPVYSLNVNFKEKIFENLNLLFNVCQLQYFIGNEFLPDLSDEIKDKVHFVPNKLYKILDKYKHNILNHEFFTDNNLKHVNIYQYIIEQIKLKIGDDGLNIIKNMISWHPNKKRINKNSNENEYGTYIEFLLNSSFFDSMRYENPEINKIIIDKVYIL